MILRVMGFALGFAVAGAAHADPDQSGPDLRYGGSLIGFQPELTMSRQIGQVEVRGWHPDAVALEVETPSIDYRNGSSDLSPRKIPGLKKHPNLHFKRPARPAPR